MVLKTKEASGTGKGAVKLLFLKSTKVDGKYVKRGDSLSVARKYVPLLTGASNKAIVDTKENREWFAQDEERRLSRVNARGGTPGKPKKD